MRFELLPKRFIERFGSRELLDRFARRLAELLIGQFGSEYPITYDFSSKSPSLASS